MDSFWMVISLIYFVVSLVATIANIILTYDDCGETNLFKYAFNTQITFWHGFSDELNLAGLILVMIFVSIFLWPSNILLLIEKILEWVGKFLWECFLFIFGKRKE